MATRAKKIQLDKTIEPILFIGVGSAIGGSLNKIIRKQDPLKLSKITDKSSNEYRFKSAMYGLPSIALGLLGLMMAEKAKKQKDIITNIAMGSIASGTSVVFSEFGITGTSYMPTYDVDYQDLTEYKALPINGISLDTINGDFPVKKTIAI